MVVCGGGVWLRTEKLIEAELVGAGGIVAGTARSCGARDDDEAYRRNKLEAHIVVAFVATTP
mgnify:CR=1 FL=1